MTHDELQEDLATHLRGNTDRMVWTNTQLGPAASPTTSASRPERRRRREVIAVNLSSARAGVHYARATLRGG